MIKYSINYKNSGLNLEVSGNAVMIASEVIYLMSEIYSEIKANNPDSAKDFKEYITIAIKDGLVFVSEEERRDIVKKKYEEVAVQLAKKVLDTIFDSTKEQEDDTDTDSD